MSKSIRGIAFVAVSGAALAGCVTPAPPPPPVIVRPPVVVIPSRPTPPNGAATGFFVPVKDVYGNYPTPSIGLGRDETLWHMRMALNVAALACDPMGPVTPMYGQFLTLHSKPLAAANKAEDQLFKTQFGKNAVKERDTHMTNTYNFYSLPPVTRDFCRVATDVLTIANATPSEALLDYAPTGLAALDGAFTNFFGAYAQYEIDVVAWDNKYGTPRPAYAPSAYSPAPVTYSPGTGSGAPVTFAPGTGSPVAPAPVPATPPSTGPVYGPVIQPMPTPVPPSPQR